MRRLPGPSDERGVALAVAVFALVIIGALVAGTFFIGRLEQQGGRNGFFATQAAEAADAGIVDRLDQLDPVDLAGVAIYTGNPGQEVVYATRSIGGDARLVSTETVRRLNGELFLVRADGRRLGAGGEVLASRTLARLVRLWKPTIGVRSAITVMDPIRFNGNAFEVSGINQAPAGWGCPTPRADGMDDLVGIRSATATGVGAGDDDNIQGYPGDAVAYDPQVTSATFQDFLDYTFTSLGDDADKVLTSNNPYAPEPSVLDDALPISDQVCDRDDLNNLGEPRRDANPANWVFACRNYFPVVHGTHPSRTKFSAGARGQGTLLIDGDLEISGGFEWSGLVIVRGSFKVSGNGNKITGALLAEGVSDLDNSLSGNVTIQYSQCAVERAVAGASTAMPLTQRSWTNLNGL